MEFENSSLRIFVVGVGNGYLPTKTALSLKRVALSTQCPACNVTAETTLHCLVHCNFAQACSRGVRISSFVENDDGFASWLECLMSQNSDAKLAELVMLLGLSGKLVTQWFAPNISSCG